MEPSDVWKFWPFETEEAARTWEEAMESVFPQSHIAPMQTRPAEEVEREFGLAAGTLIGRVYPRDRGPAQLPLGHLREDHPAGRGAAILEALYRIADTLGTMRLAGATISIGRDDFEELAAWFHLPLDRPASVNGCQVVTVINFKPLRDYLPFEIKLWELVEVNGVPIRRPIPRFAEQLAGAEDEYNNAGGQTMALNTRGRCEGRLRPTPVNKNGPTLVPVEKPKRRIVLEE